MFIDVDFFAKLFTKAPLIIAGLIGGALAVLLGKKRSTIREKFFAIVIVLLSTFVTWYVTPIILLWLPTLETVEHSVGFVVGIFGIGIIEGLLNLVKKFTLNPLQTLKDLGILKK